MTKVDNWFPGAGAGGRKDGLFNRYRVSCLRDKEFWRLVCVIHNVSIRNTTELHTFYVTYILPQLKGKNE